MITFVNKEAQIKQIENRIVLLKSRAGRENGNIIKKLERKLRTLKSEA